VTQAEYLAVMGKNPSWFTSDLKCPVEQVTWSDATNYCGKLTDREQLAGRLPAGWVYRLPTESEWEYACRAGTTNGFDYGSALRSGKANFDGRYEYDATTGTLIKPGGTFLGSTTNVGSYVPNAWGLYDMHGNVAEWTQDWGASSLPGGTVTDPDGPPTGSRRVARGGSWYDIGWACRSARRRQELPTYRNTDLGFRIVLAPIQP
jgi:formylglycine-generating enzyme required for sulfatase activity